MGDALIDELIGRGAASRGQVDEAKRRLAASGGHLVERLVEVGCSADRILATWTASTGIPAAPRSALARPIVPVGLGVAPETWRELGALPFGTDDDGNVLVALADPAAREPLLALDLPDVVVHLATFPDVAAGLRRAFPELFDDEAGQATAPGSLPALPLDDEASRLPGDELPTMALAPVRPPGAPTRRGFELPPTSSDDLSAEDVLRRLAADVREDVGARTLSHTLDEPRDEEEPDGLFGAVDDFDDPTQAVDSRELMPFLQGAGAGGPSLPTNVADPDVDLAAGASAFDGEDEPKTVAMTVDDIRASLKARGAPGSTLRSDGPAPPSLFPDVGGEEDEDEFEPKTVAMTVEEMRASVASRGAPSPTADDARPPPARSGAPAAATDEPDDGPAFDYAAAADEFDDGEGSDAATAVRPRSTEQEESSLLFSAEPPYLAEPVGDDFDEKTVAADGLDLLVSPPAAGGVQALPSGDADVLFDDDEDDSTQVRVFDDEEDAAEQKLAEARTRMAAALEGLDALPPLDEQHSDVFVTDDDVDASEATQAGIDPSEATRISVHEEIGATGDLGATGEIGSVPTAAIPMVQRATPIAAEPAKAKAVDTAPTGPIAVRGYDVKDVLGAGGMATVYRAFQREAEREVALKILAPHLANDAAFVARFRREIRSSASLTHPNIIRVYDYGDESGVYYMATEVMDGGSLRDALHELGALPVPLVVKLLEHLLRGIGHAHQRGMVHRDIKPANLMLSSEGLLKLGDFGIAKSETDENLTRTGALFGTPAYMSPEQALGRAVEPPSDLFSCGIIAYELLTGDNPYAAETASASLLKVSRADAPPLLLKSPAAPPLLVDVVERLQKRDASERYGTAEEALSDLRPLIEAVDRRWPDLVQRYVADARGTRDAILKEHAQAELERARHHLAADPPLRFAGAVAAYLASVLDPDDAGARALLAELGEDFHFGPSTDPRVHDAERSLEEEPRAPGLLRRTADLYRAGGNPFKAAVWLRQYLGVKPTDSHARHQLGLLIGPSPLAGFDEWEAPIPELTWDDIADAPGGLPEETQVPPSEPPAKDPAAGLDLRPIESMPPLLVDSAPVPPAPLPAGVRPALRTSEPSEMLRAATARARGGLQVLKTDGPPTPVPSSAYNSPPMPWSPGAAPPVGPALQTPQQTYAVPRAAGQAPAAPRAGIPKALKIALAATLSLALLLVIVVVAVLALSSDGTDELVRKADPGASTPVPERQGALLAFARERLADGDGVRALQAASLAYALDPQSPRGGEALLLRGRAAASVGDPASAARDFEQVLARFPEGNLLHLEAKQQLKELPR